MCLSPVLFRFPNPSHPKQVYGIGAAVREDSSSVSLSQYKRALGIKPIRGDGAIYKRGARIRTPKRYQSAHSDFASDPYSFALTYNLPIVHRVPTWTASDLDDDPIGKPTQRIRGLYKPFVLCLPEASTLCMYVPCGRCPQCQQKKVNEWTFRLSRDMACTKELQAYYMTLTFRPEDLPLDAMIDPRAAAAARHALAAVKNSRGSARIAALRSLVPYKHLRDKRYVHDDGGLLQYKLFQDFKQRLKVTLKRWYGIKNLKFFVCGEYGKKTARPHFHAVIWFSATESSLHGYSADVPKRGKSSQSFFVDYITQTGRVPALSPLFFSKLVFHLWSHCEWQAFDCSPVRNSAATSRYITKYMLKNRLFLSRNLRELDRVAACPPCFHRSCKLAYNWADTFCADIMNQDAPMESMPIQWKDKHTGLMRHSVDVVPLVLCRRASDTAASLGLDPSLANLYRTRAERCQIAIREVSDTPPIDHEAMTRNLLYSTLQMDRFE